MTKFQHPFHKNPNDDEWRSHGAMQRGFVLLRLLVTHMQAIYMYVCLYSAQF